MRIGKILATLVITVALSFSATGTSGAAAHQSIPESTTKTCRTGNGKQGLLSEEKDSVAIEQARQKAMRFTEVGAVACFGYMR